MKFSKKEIKDLLAAWLFISLAFAILFTDSLVISVFITAFIISLLTAGIGFLLHELMHKYFAQKYHLWAEFRASYPMLYLAIFFSFLGFIIAAPGAVILKGNVNKEKNGKISLAGPMTNIILAILFLIAVFLTFKQNLSFLNLFFNYGFKINSLLALFNMIPVMPFDGSKVYSWNKSAYFITIIISGALFLTSFFI